MHFRNAVCPLNDDSSYRSFLVMCSSVLASLEREEAEHLIKTHGGRITGSVSKKTVRIWTLLFTNCTRH